MFLLTADRGLAAVFSTAGKPQRCGQRGRRKRPACRCPPLMPRACNILGGFSDGNYSVSGGFLCHRCVPAHCLGHSSGDLCVDGAVSVVGYIGFSASRVEITPLP